MPIDHVFRRVDAAWDRIEDWLEAHAPITLAGLGAYATQGEIDAVQTRMGTAFPPDLVASLLRHNGALDRLGFFFPPDFTGAGLPEILDAWTTNSQVLEPPLWDRSYVPFAWTGDGGLLVLDGKGRVGEFYAEDGTTFEGLPPSLAEFLERIADSLQTGEPCLGDHVPIVSEGRLEWAEE
ncbi:SMI1/KNR4 family protein [Paractinoplanes atraurantiacus]|uniref:Cell wall assembly regulator SMI1 n=1 Tax=Paractinoplanes atraurantiacus TaxID=1036182 RepID=A0A285KC35_9ACTN|nr:SMI1/KNR4 family protein [Actinoplanes atraurantiacus]SNY69803.1 Cell wall assembly regulator SMI1 [Actinoplanes atraurantiacus]